MAKKEVIDLNEELEKELSNMGGFGDMLELAENVTDMTVSCVPTGFPQLDLILHKELKGLPCGRDIEIFSKEPEVGKTSLGLQILQNWQRLGKRTAIIDVERTITKEFLNQLGIITVPNDPSIIAVRIVRPEDGLSAEQVLDLVKQTSNVFDLVVVDSIGAMDIKANLEKESDENNKIGAMALLLSNFLKRNVAKRATVIWINQTRQVVGGYTPAGQGVRYATMGGRALPFFGSIRIDLSIIEKLKDSQEDVYAFKVKAYTQKNKVSPQYKSAIMTYMMGEGFSVVYDYFDMALKMKLIQKSGSWYSFGDVKVQGDIAFYKKMSANPELLDAVKKEIEAELVQAGAAGVKED